LSAFRRKNALHGIQVDTPKLIPMATSSQIKHWLCTFFDICCLSEAFEIVYDDNIL